MAKIGPIMNNYHKIFFLIMLLALSGCSQIENVVFLNRSGSDSWFAISETNGLTRLEYNSELTSWKILRYQNTALIKLKKMKAVYEYREKAVLSPHWKHYVSRSEIVLCLMKDEKIYICDPDSKNLLKPQPVGFPLVPTITK